VVRLVRNLCRTMGNTMRRSPIEHALEVAVPFDGRGAAFAADGFHRFGERPCKPGAVVRSAVERKHFARQAQRAVVGEVALGRPKQPKVAHQRARCI